MNKILKLIGTMTLGLSLMGCSSQNTNTSEDIVSESETTSVNQIENEQEKEVVEVKVAEQTTSYSSLVEMISDVKASVVDVTSIISATSTSSGSGVIIGQSDDGYYIITNHHVIESASSFTVTVYPDETSSGVEYNATLIGGSPKNDIAVLKVVTSDTFTIATFIEDSTSVKVGTSVVAIGNPLGIYGGSVTQGIISAIAREVYIEEIGYMTLFQTDAAINSGNSGGALFDENGLLVGIVNSGYSSYEGLNFAIPANQARSAMESLIDTYNEDGNGNYGYVVGETNVGLSLSSTQIYSSSSLDSRVNVVYVNEVEDNTDASKNDIYSYASLRDGSSSYFYAINAVNGTEVSEAKTAQELIDEVEVGETLTLNVTKISYSRFGMGQTAFYLNGDAFDISFSISQYIYSI